MRFALVAVAVATAAGPSFGQPTPKPVDGKVVIKLDLSPAGVLRPSSRLRLLPDLREARAGNQVQGFMKCFAEQRNFYGPEEYKQRDRWNELPLAAFDLPQSQWLDYGGASLRQADRAARMQFADWQVLDDLRQDGINTLLPDAQIMRSVASALKTRSRGRIKAGAFDKAVDSIATTLALGRAFETHPTLIGHLVGVAISLIGLTSVEEAVQQPGCPNLYWALTALPRPLVGLRTSLAGELVLVEAHFPGLFTEVWTDDELAKRLGEFDKLVALEQKGENKPKPGTPVPPMPAERVAKWAADPARVAAARARLIDSGVPADLARKMSAKQAVLADDIRTYQTYLDEQMDWMALPFWQAKGGLAEYEKRIAKVKDDSFGVALLLPHASKVRAAQARLEQYVAVLQVVEAIRLYAHEKSGELPPTLGVLTVPVPADPVSGEPFRYTVNDGVGVLMPVSAYPDQPAMNKVYEIRIRK